MINIALTGDSLRVVEELASKRGLATGQVIAEAFGLYSYLAHIASYEGQRSSSGAMADAK